MLPIVDGTIVEVSLHCRNKETRISVGIDHFEEVSEELIESLQETMLGCIGEGGGRARLSVTHNK